MGRIDGNSAHMLFSVHISQENTRMLKISGDIRRSDDSVDEETIVKRIYEAIIEQRLPPGTKLSEASLCKAFSVGRMRVRGSLLLLASRGVVDLKNNRGAYVASPTPQRALEIFEARRAIEPSVARFSAERASGSDIRKLTAHLRQEEKANRRGDRRAAIRLSGQFHVEIAKVARNEVMENIVKELVTRTSLIIGMFGAPGTSNCHDEEHRQILESVTRHEAEAAARLMELHLRHIERQIDLTAERRKRVDLVEILSVGAS